jgi:hypothetical protein
MLWKMKNLSELHEVKWLCRICEQTIITHVPLNGVPMHTCKPRRARRFPMERADEQAKTKGDSV